MDGGADNRDENELSEGTPNDPRLDKTARFRNARYCGFAAGGLQSANNRLETDDVGRSA